VSDEQVVGSGPLGLFSWGGKDERKPAAKLRLKEENMGRRGAAIILKNSAFITARGDCTRGGREGGGIRPEASRRRREVLQLWEKKRTFIELGGKERKVEGREDSKR